jgi:hypothetical protein
MIGSNVRAARIAALGAAALLVVLAGCSKDSDSGGPLPGISGGGGGAGDTTSFAGFMASPANIGRLDITVESVALAPRPQRAPSVPTAPQSPQTVTARGTLQWPGGDVALTGTYDFNADTLYLTGTDRVLRGRFGGSGNTGGLVGDAATPDGPASFLAAHDALAPWVPWCGSFHSDTGNDSGSFGFIRSAGYMSGTIFQEGATASMVFNGTLTGSDLSFTFNVPNRYSVSGTGTLNDASGNAQGAYAITTVLTKYGHSSTGTWSATRR